MENGPSPHADSQSIRLALFSPIVRTGAGSDLCLSKRPGLACNASSGVGTPNLSILPPGRSRAVEVSWFAPRKSIRARLWLAGGNAHQANHDGPGGAITATAVASNGHELIAGLEPPGGWLVWPHRAIGTPRVCVILGGDPF